MKKLLLILTVLSLSFGLCGELNSPEKSKKTTEERFFDYVTGKGKSYKALKQYQEDAEFHLEAGHILSLSWFYKGEIRIGMIFMLDNFGSYVLVKNLFAWEKKNVKKGRLSPEKLELIKAGINKIKDEKVAPQIGKEYYVSYRKGLRWKNTVYDTAKLPEYIESIIASAGIKEEE